ncbi:hypothetical protein BC629DRAFT_1548163 [Irpex lacteus]|nr:hypothetical protein BC629DRAFT_1548163 [Irpex lacteus]
MPTTRRRTRELSMNTQAAAASQIPNNNTTQHLLNFNYVWPGEEAPRMPQANNSKGQGKLPPRVEFDQAQDEYVQSLSKSKQAKALLTQETFDDIWDVLHDRTRSRIRTPQFRFWVRKMFTLSVQPTSTLPGYGTSTSTPNTDELEGEVEGGDLKPVILHAGRPVAVKSQIYDIIGHCHQLCQHGGRDKTTAHVKELYSWIPKELVAKFVKMCPTCNSKRSTIAQRVSPPVRSRAPTPARVSAASAPTPTPTQEEMSTSRVLPPPTPHPGSILASSDPHLWLSHLVCEPGPASPSPDMHLAPLLRRTESENDAVPRRRPATRTNLPPLMKALSEDILDTGVPVQRVAYNVPESLQIPLRAQEYADEYSMDIDPCLFDPSPPCSDVRPGYSRRGSVIATPIELPRKSLIPSSVSLVDIRHRSSASASSRSSASSTNSSSLSSSANSSVSSQRHSSCGSMAISNRHTSTAASISARLGDTSINSVSSAGRKSDRSVNSAQDWELSYCLDNSY